MKSRETLWQKLGLHEWFLKQGETSNEASVLALTPEDIYSLLVSKFKESIGQLSFANRIVFFHEYIVCFNTEDYRDFMDTKKGLFGHIIHEAVDQYYKILKEYRKQGKTVEPSSNKWVFRFVSNPDYRRGDKSVIGKLLPGASQQKQENLRVTYIPRQTGIAETFDVSDEILRNFTFYSDGYYEVPYQEELDANDKIKASLLRARLETIVPDREFVGKKIDFLMKEEEILVSGKDEMQEGSHIFKIPSDWVNAPHLKIRYNADDQKFYLTSFGDKTVLNEYEIPQSDPSSPAWIELPLNSKIVLNGIVGINFFKA